MAEGINVQDTNVPAEMCFVGSLYKNPDLFVQYGSFMRSKYDFSDPVVKFFYDNFEIYFTTYSQTVDETKINMFMTQKSERLETYKEYKGWKTVKRFMDIADDGDSKNYFNLVKKYSLIREYGRNGFPIEKIVNHKNFEKMNQNDIYRIIRVKADKIHTVINAGEESVDLSKGAKEQVQGYLKKPNFGLAFPWYMYNEYFLGQRETKVVFEGFLSNEGKTRKLMMLAAYTAFVKEENFLFMSNEMDEEDLKSCLYTTVINNNEFKSLHGINISKPEKEIVLGIYRDNNGNIIKRYTNNDGVFIETDKEFVKRIEKDSSEYWEIMKVMEWVDNKERKGKVFFKDVGDDYSIERIELELRKAKMVSNIKYYGYDTLKGYNTDEWSAIKQFATRLKELTKELKMSGFSVFQLSDDTVYTDIFGLSSNNIANAKQIKHVADILTMGKRLEKDEYHKYRMIPEKDVWGDAQGEELDLNKIYFAIKTDKNRAGGKDKIMLFEIDLNLNIWINVGYLIRNKR